MYKMQGFPCTRRLLCLDSERSIEALDRMAPLLYVRLIGYTAGTLLMLFWMVAILGYRRQRNFERVLFFLCLALFFFYGGSLLALNAEIHYRALPAGLAAFAEAVIYAGLCLLPALLAHLHLEFAETRALLASRTRKRLWLLAAYAPLPYFVLTAYSRIGGAPRFNWVAPASALGRGYGMWLALALLFGAGWELRFAKTASERAEQLFHGVLAGVFLLSGTLAAYVYAFGGAFSASWNAGLSTTLAFLAIPPAAALIYMMQQHNFLQIGRQKNLVYAVSVTFLALLYLSLVRRVGGWLEPVLPPEASAAILLFVLVIFIEPLQRVLGRRLKETAREEMDRVQQLMAEIQQEARQGDAEKLARFIGRRVQETFELGSARFDSREPLAISGAERQLSQGHEFGELRSGEPDVGLLVREHGRRGSLAGNRKGLLIVEPHGAGLSGETRAALEFLCEQLPAGLDLCRLIEEKLHLERELAERERMAALGQMAASISHNLKNPLGSIKTILQVQLENAELPEGLRRETRLMLDEISRLSARLNQLLQFSRPAALAGKNAAGCEANAVAREVIEVLRHGADQKGLTLELVSAGGPVRVSASAEAFNDMLSNLVVNAMDATSKGGRVHVGIGRHDGQCVVRVEDDGPGIPAEVREKILQPFFTTKAQGTGLGLAIVARRAAEAGGKVEVESPAENERGARFTVWLPLEEEKA